MKWSGLRASDPQYAATCGMLGDCYLYSDQPELAEAAYRRALKSGKKDAQVYFALARASAAMGNAEATADMLVKAVGLDPTIARLAVTNPYLRKLPARPTPPPSKEGDEPANRADRR
jgi:tetratricopeptide (TPR) repeat protein